jgi:cholesterol transport system auxiliary component
MKPANCGLRMADGGLSRTEGGLEIPNFRLRISDVRFRIAAFAERRDGARFARHALLRIADSAGRLPGRLWSEGRRDRGAALRTGRESAIRNSQSAIKMRVLAVALVLSAGGLFGCAQSQPPRQYYLLAAERPPAAEGAAPAGAERGVLLVRSFRVAPAFAGRQLVYRVSDFRYETDYYHQYLVPPGEMLAERTRDWLASSGLFRQVIGAGSAVPPTWTLTGDVSALYGDFAGPGAPTAVLEIRFSLLGPPEDNEPVLFAQNYQ